MGGGARREEIGTEYAPGMRKFESGVWPRFTFFEGSGIYERLDSLRESGNSTDFMKILFEFQKNWKILIYYIYLLFLYCLFHVFSLLLLNCDILARSYSCPAVNRSFAGCESAGIKVRGKV